MYGNDIYKPLPLVAGKVFTSAFFNRLAVRIANIINETESALICGRLALEITIVCPLRKNQE